jgi:hypothetical protein
MTKWKTAALLAIFWLGLVVLFFGPALAPDKSFFSGDIQSYFYPMKHFLAESLRAGQLPHWNPFEKCGLPFLANPQVATFYPLSLLFALLPFPQAFTTFILLHFVLGPIFFFILGRTLGFSRLTSLAGSLIFSYNGIMLSQLQVLDNLQSAVWVPLLFASYLHYFRQRSPIWLLGAILSETVALLSGNPIIIFFSLILLIFLFLIQPEWRGSWRFLIQTLILINVLALSLAAVQLIPFLRLVGLSARVAGNSLESLTEWSFSPLLFLSFLVPNFCYNPVTFDSWPQIFGTPKLTWLPSHYHGLAVLVLAGLALFTWRQQPSGRVRFIPGAIWGGLIFSLLALGHYCGLYRFLLQALPILRWVRFPERYLFFVSFLLALLAMAGLEILLHDQTGRRSWRLLTRLATSLTLLVVVALILMNFLVWPAGQGGYQDHLTAGLWQMLLVVGLIGLIAWIGSRQSTMVPRWLGIMLILLILGDLFLANRDLNPVTDTRLYQQPPHFARLLPDARHNYRLQSFEAWGQQNSRLMRQLGPVERLALFRDEWYPNLGTLYGFHVADGSNVLNFEKQMRLLANLRHESLPFRWEMLRLTNARYLVAVTPLTEPTLQLINYDPVDELFLYEFPGALPRAWLVHESRQLRQDSEALPLILKRQVDLSRTALLLQNEVPSSPDIGTWPGNERDQVHIEEYSGNRVVLTTESSSAALLILLDTWYPEWQARVDGRVVKLLRADYLFRGITLTAGRHEIVMTYEAHSFWLGLAISGATALGLLVFGIRRSLAAWSRRIR